MCHCRSSSRRQMSFGGLAGRGDWGAWLPLLFVGAMMFWTVALGLGGWSLMAVTDGAMEEAAAGPAPTVTEPMPGAAAQGAAGGADRIPVQVEESQEPEDVNDNAGAVPRVGVWPMPNIPDVAPAAN
jgi:hypothetical protein